jgi:uncharacterized protein
MIFEYDELKSKSNLSKHGIDFESAKQLWSDPFFVEVPTKNVVEKRFLIVGKIIEKHWSAIITYRNSNIRIISVRRARKE